MEAAQVVAPGGPGVSRAAVRQAFLRAALAKAAITGVAFLLAHLLSGTPPWPALRDALMFSAMMACVHAPWVKGRLPRWAGSWQGWVLGFVAVTVVGVIWRLLGLPAN